MEAFEFNVQQTITHMDWHQLIYQTDIPAMRLIQYIQRTLLKTNWEYNKL